MPRTKVGRRALVFTAIGLASWIILPLITMNFREEFPVTDTWIMPVIATVLIVLAAVYNAACIWRWHERSTLNIVATIVTLPVAIFSAFMVIGEGLSGI